jgi:hypothetical protein
MLFEQRSPWRVILNIRRNGVHDQFSNKNLVDEKIGAKNYNTVIIGISKYHPMLQIEEQNQDIFEFEK